MGNSEIKDEASNFKEIPDHSARAFNKLDDLISVVREDKLDDKALIELHQKFRQSIKLPERESAVELYSSASVSHSKEMGADVGQLMFMNKLDKRSQRKSSLYQIVTISFRIVISVLLILLGFGMIIMPAPPYFEMFTLFYLNPNDGVTIMDVISLIVAFSGVYILISSFTSFKGKS